MRRRIKGSFKQIHHHEFKSIMQLKKTSILKSNCKEYSDKTTKKHNATYYYKTTKMEHNECFGVMRFQGEKKIKGDPKEIIIW